MKVSSRTFAVMENNFLRQWLNYFSKGGELSKSNSNKKQSGNQHFFRRAFLGKGGEGAQMLGEINWNYLPLSCVCNWKHSWLHAFKFLSLWKLVLKRIYPPTFLYYYFVSNSPCISDLYALHKRKQRKSRWKALFMLGWHR